MTTHLKKYQLGRNKRSHAKGWIRYNNKEMYFKSLYEMNYAAYLQWLMIKGEIDSWEYEPKEFAFPKDKYKANLYYKPDFKVIENAGNHHWHEVKGYMDAKSKTKIRRFNKHFGETEGNIVVVDKKWFTATKKQSHRIPNWLTLDQAKEIFSPMRKKEKNKFVWNPTYSYS